MLEPQPILFHLGAFQVYTHGAFFALGGFVGIFTLLFLAKSAKLPVYRLEEKGLALFLAGLFAARLGYFLTYPSQFDSVAQVLAIWEGGLVSYWGIAGGLLAFAVVFKEEKLRWLDVLVLAALVGWAVGRQGNFFAGDSAGVASSSWSLTYGRVPVQLFEAFACLLVAFVTWRWWKQGRPAGVSALLGIGGYLAFRFVIDFWRDEPVLAGLHYSQWASLFLLVLVTGLLTQFSKPHAQT